MTRKIILTMARDSMEMMRRYGFNGALALMIADELGGVWQMDNCGCGRELLMPFRCLTVENYRHHAEAFERNDGVASGDMSVCLCSCGENWEFKTAFQRDWVRAAYLSGKSGDSREGMSEVKDARMAA